MGVADRGSPLQDGRGVMSALSQTEEQLLRATFAHLALSEGPVSSPEKRTPRCLDGWAPLSRGGRSTRGTERLGSIDVQGLGLEGKYAVQGSPLPGTLPELGTRMWLRLLSISHTYSVTPVGLGLCLQPLLEAVLLAPCPGGLLTCRLG